jgi:hypothetical protein
VTWLQLPEDVLARSSVELFGDIGIVYVCFNIEADASSILGRSGEEESPKPHQENCVNASIQILS